jgi:hypothetical protein
MIMLVCTSSAQLFLYDHNFLWACPIFPQGWYANEISTRKPSLFTMTAAFDKSSIGDWQPSPSPEEPKETLATTVVCTTRTRIAIHGV